MHIPFRDKEEILHHADCYMKHRSYEGDTNREADARIASTIGAARQRGYMTHEDLRATARWKIPPRYLRRVTSRIDENSHSPDEVAEISRVSFDATTQRLRVGALLTLSGVRWPMASAILHFAFPDEYPIVDKRVLHATDWQYKNPANFNFSRWIDFTESCRYERGRFDVTMRNLDRALWTYDKEGGNR